MERQTSRQQSSSDRHTM